MRSGLPAGSDSLTHADRLSRSRFIGPDGGSRLPATGRVLLTTAVLQAHRPGARCDVRAERLLVGRPLSKNCYARRPHFVSMPVTFSRTYRSETVISVASRGRLRPDQAALRRYDVGCGALPGLSLTTWGGKVRPEGE
jgi:hypothetical protein